MISKIPPLSSSGTLKVRRKKNWLYLGTTVLVAYIAFTKLMPGGAGGWGMGPMPVSVAEVLQKPTRQWQRYSGRITAVDLAEVRPRVSGVIQEVRLKDGERVAAGDVLIVIDPRPFAAQVTAAEGQLGSAEAQLALAKSDMARAQKLIKDNAIPQFQLDQTRNALNVAEANVKTAQAALEIARLNYDYAHVKAPIAGRVSRAEITVGNLVEAGSNAPLLTSVVSANEVYVDFDVDESSFLKYAHAGVADDVERIKTIPVRLALADEKDMPHQGYLKSFDNRISTASGTIRARAVLDNSSGALVSGMFATVELGGPEEKTSLLITDRAIGTDQNKKFVYVVLPDNKTERREVVLGALTDEGLRVVESGLNPGDRIVVNGTQRIMMPEQEVVPEAAPMIGGDAPQTNTAPPAEPTATNTESKP